MPAYSAPALHFAVARARAPLYAVGVLSALSALNLLAWAGMGTVPSLWMGAGAAVLWLVGSACALQWAWCLPTGDLCWDGAQWCFQGRPVLPRVHLDAQNYLLLSLPALHPGPLQWLWVESGMQPERWLDLRRALFARPPAPPKATTLSEKSSA